MRTSYPTIAIVLLMLAIEPAPAASDPAQKCEAGENLTLGKYALCLQKAQKKSVLGAFDSMELQAAVQACIEKYASSWDTLETKAEGSCPYGDDATGVQGFVDACIATAQEALGGAPLPPDVISCNTGLADCTDQAAVCGNDLTGCENDLSATNADLSGCNSTLSSTNADLGACNSALSTANVDLGACNTALSTTNADLGACSTALSSTNADLGTCTTSLGTCNGDLQICAAGTASSGDVLAGKSFSSAAGLGLSGSMPDNGTVFLTPSVNDQPIAAGYHDGDGRCGGDADLLPGNIRLGANMFGVAGTVVQASGNAIAAEVLADRTFSNAAGSGTGSMPNRGAVTLLPGISDRPIPNGFHDGTGKCSGDSDLLTGNIRLGVNLFGVVGKQPPAQPLQTGQFDCYNRLGVQIGCIPGQDGVTRTGVPRNYTDNGTGTITDNRTGLVWEKLSDDGSIHDWDNVYQWDMAQVQKVTLLNQTIFGGYGDWRLPNQFELYTLAQLGAVSPAVDPIFDTGCTSGCSPTACSCTASAYYWSSTSYVGTPSAAWFVGFDGGYTGAGAKANYYGVRAVRGGL